MRLFFAYVSAHRRVIIMFLLFCAVFGVTFALYRLPVGAEAYPALLCVLFGVVYAVFDIGRAARKHRVLSRIRSRADAVSDELPAARTLDDGDYQAIIKSLCDEASQNEDAYAERFRDTVDYYTAWVHQIKTPITSMRLTLEREDSPVFRSLSSDLFMIEQYVGMVLAFLRLDADTNDFVFAECRLGDVIDGAISKFASEFIARKIRLEYTPTDASVVTDEKWLSFVIEQILSNSLKYTREGSVMIYVREPKTLCIEDTGIGIAKSDLPRVFEKGYTGYNGRTDKRASGLGLYLCRRICDSLGAKIDISSEVGRGTLVSVDLEQYELGRE